MPPSSPPSVTSTDSFLLCSQRSEQNRTVLIIGLFACVLALNTARRLAGGVVMTNDSVLFPCGAGRAGVNPDRASCTESAP